MNNSDILSARLNARAMEKIFNGLNCEVDVIVLPTVESTNTWLLESGATAPVTLCAAEHQTIGRGRRGKTWHSPNSGVTFSIRLNRAESVAQFNGLSLLVGARLCDQVREIGAQQAMVKWPNDVLVSNAKLAGILIETSVSASATSGTTVVIGIGINYKRGAEARQIDQSSTDLYELCGDNLPSRSELIARVASKVIKTVANDTPKALQDLAVQWSGYDALAGTEITIHSGHDKIHGRAIGIDDNGGLKVETSKGVEVFYSAEISVRAR